MPISSVACKVKLCRGCRRNHITHTSNGYREETMVCRSEAVQSSSDHGAGSDFFVIWRSSSLQRWRHGGTL